ncbi:MAG: tRNA (cytosine(32)/uridine(32)-2'-O)-methyltransferase TrmJ, partial [Haliea sp.]|nr:tRNA (cytosine(32)/uridine(32)-2'-O)-methyltransferase TrmJ [Haliea sp.]
LRLDEMELNILRGILTETQKYIPKPARPPQDGSQEG